MVYTGFPLENIRLGHTTYTSQPGKLVFKAMMVVVVVVWCCCIRLLPSQPTTMVREGAVCAVCILQFLHIRDFLLYSVRNMWATPTTTITITG